MIQRESAKTLQRELEPTHAIMLKTLQCFCCAVLCSIPASSHKGSAPAELSARLSQSCSRGRRALQMQQQEPTCPTLSNRRILLLLLLVSLLIIIGMAWPVKPRRGRLDGVHSKLLSAKGTACLEQVTLFPWKKCAWTGCTVMQRVKSYNYTRQSSQRPQVVHVARDSDNR